MPTQAPRDDLESLPSVELIEGTRAESVEEIRQARLARRLPTSKETVSAETTAYRPTRRPPLALLCILDDGSDEGEWVRLRADRITIGRSEGDIVIPHDAMMSSRHADLVRVTQKGRARWRLQDLQSTNGSYLRVGVAALQHQQEIMLGIHRFRFECSAAGPPSLTDAKAVARETTQAWTSVTPEEVFPALVELTTKGDGKRHMLTDAEARIGRHARGCSIVLNDPLVSPLHARVYRDDKGRWLVENLKSLNGVWLRVAHAPLDSTCQFQLGEQRFLLKVL